MKKISENVGMELTETREDENLNVEFLDCTIYRNQNLTISSRWSKKIYSSLSILNFHSYHPVIMKRNVILEMIRHAFEVTSPEYTEEAKSILHDILRRSSYPEALINAYIVPFTTTSLPKLIGRYVSCPYSKPSYSKIKMIIHQNQLNVKLAPKPISNNRRILFSKVKDVRDASQIKNCVFKICCNSCSFTHICTTGNFDVQRTFRRVINDISSPCRKHTLDYPNHYMNKEIFIIKTFYNKFDADHSKYILKRMKGLKGRRMIVN